LNAIDPPSGDRKRLVALKLSVIARQLRLKFDQTITQRGVTRAKWSLIAAVASRPGVTQRVIATMLEVTEVTAGRLIDRLCTDGYLERRENPADRRGYCVYLTPAAQPVLNQMDEIAKLHEVESFANLTDDDLAKLDELLTIIARNLAISQS
jgi:MarR family transcriptional regulator for hemolysin